MGYESQGSEWWGAGFFCGEGGMAMSTIQCLPPPPPPPELIIGRQPLPHFASRGQNFHGNQGRLSATWEAGSGKDREATEYLDYLLTVSARPLKTISDESWLRT